MSDPLNLRTPLPGLLVYALLSRSAEWEERAVELIRKECGPLALLSPSHPFPWTDYYAREVGNAPLRRYVATDTLLPREELPDRKRESIGWERSFADERGRPVNIDAGCLTVGHLFLASTKDHKQRVYTGGGIYVEPTLFFRENKWEPFPWTYADFRSEIGDQWLRSSRELLKQKLEKKAPL